MPQPFVTTSMPRGRAVAWWLSLALLASGGSAGAASPEVFEDLITRGVAVESGERLTVPGPRLPDGLTREQQDKALREAAGKHPLDRFLRDSIVAPFSFDITSADDASGKRRGQRVDFCFVAYGRIQSIIHHDLFQELVGSQEAREPDAERTSVRTLTADELQSRGLAPRKTAGVDETYVLVDVPILNRVRLTGVGFGQRENHQESLVAAMTLDERFRDDPDFPNRWRSIGRDAQGKTTVGPATPYAGIGGYIKITQLQEPAGAIFIECHIAFDEPQGWFGGKNLLRSKLPLVIQDNVRAFRRKLAKES
ncbi:MAG: hypothetical protein HYX69_08795 [Planctomycetia bacterium]|nr:hypothetical protein [Planctomycetia bacterium]